VRGQNLYTLCTSKRQKGDTVIFIRSVAETAARSVESHKRLVRFLHSRCCCEAQSEDTTVSHRNVRRACIRMPCARRLKRQRWVRWRRVVVNTWELVIVTIRTRQAVASRELRRNAASLRPMRSGQIIRDDRGERSRSRDRMPRREVADAAILEHRMSLSNVSMSIFLRFPWHLYGINTRFAARNIFASHLRILSPQRRAEETRSRLSLYRAWNAVPSQIGRFADYVCLRVRPLNHASG